MYTYIQNIIFSVTFLIQPDYYIETEDGGAMLALCMIPDTPEAQSRFEEIYNCNKNIMYNCAYSVLGDVSSAEDAVSDAFLSLARNFDKLDTSDNSRVRSYLMISVRNAAYKQYNKRKREVAAEDIYLDTETDDNIAIDTENKQIHKLLFEKIKLLDKKYGDIIMLRYYCDMKEKDIADTLGISTENVKIRLHRAKNTLKKMLSQEGYHD